MASDQSAQLDAVKGADVEDRIKRATTIYKVLIEAELTSVMPPTARPASITASCPQAVVVATGASADGRREVLGFDVGDCSVEL